MPILDKVTIHEVFTKEKQEQWPYPKIFNALKDAGVEYYEADVASHETADHGHGATRVESPPGDFAPITPSSKFDFDQVGVQRAIRQNQEKQTDLRLMRRGIPRFEVAKRAARRDAVRPLATLSPADFGTVSQRLAALASTSGDGTEATQS